MNSGIYCIRNIENNKRYIGQTRNFKYRWKRHLKDLSDGTHNPKLQNAYNKYGEKCFVLEVLEHIEYDKNIFDMREKYWISFYDSIINGYNCTDGGSEGFTVYGNKRTGLDHQFYGKHHTEETRKIISDKLSGENSPLFGKPLSEEHKKKLSDSHKGVKLSDEHKRKISEAGKNRVWTEETKRKIRETFAKNKLLKGKTHLSDEHKRKLSEHFKKHPHSEEARQKMSEASKRGWAKRREQTKTSQYVPIQKNTECKEPDQGH